MLSWIGSSIAPAWGPLRLLQSHLFLAVAGFSASALGTWILLPMLWRSLPANTGRAFAEGGTRSVGKPTGGGLIFVSVFVVVSVLAVPIGSTLPAAVAAIAAAMTAGFLDDRTGGFHEYLLGAIDFAVSITTAFALHGFRPAVVWLPFVSGAFMVPPGVIIPVTTVVLWISINATNCSDGVDGLSASLAAWSLFLLGALLYAVIGNAPAARYLLVPHDPAGATWALLAFVMLGSVLAYLWFNASPAQVLMGDAGSRPLGLLLGILVVRTMNPFLLLVVASVILMNGATGLLKISLKRFLNLHIFKRVRFPLHDYCRATLGWSDTQVLVRFVLAQMLLSVVFLAILLKVR